MDFDEHDDPDDDMPPRLAGDSHPGSAQRRPTISSGGGVKYRECQKNHAVGIGGHAVDGCGEFMPAGEEGTLDSLRCAACGCHRNFHRRDPDGSGGGVGSGPHPHQQSFSPYYRTPAGYLHQPGGHPPFLAQQRAPAAPLALPSTSGGGGGAQSRGEEEEMSGGPSGSGSRKRFRTKFTAEQKEKMLGLAERVGWRIQKQDEVAVQEFCNETGVKRHVLKVWMHNNKHTLGKKP